MIFLDFETRSPIPLDEVNPTVYAEHPGTEIICMAWAQDDEPVELWTGGPLPEAFAMEKSFRSHNVLFELSIIRGVGGFPAHMQSPGAWTDTMAWCRCLGLPGGLGRAAEILKLDEKKMNDTEKKLLRKFSRPKTTDLHGKPIYEMTTEEERGLFFEYCKQDVRTTRAIYHRLKDNPNIVTEENIVDLDRRQNLNGIRIDIEALGLLIDAVNDAAGRVDAEGQRLGVNLRSNDQIKKFLARRGVNVENAQAATLDAIDSAHPEVQNVLALRSFASKASLKKLDALKRLVNADGKIRHNMIYHKAHTGRWAGAGFQVHNLPRSKTTVEEIEKSIAQLRSGEALPIADLVHAAKIIIPGLIIPDPGHVFILGDFAQIEARILAVMAGQKDLVSAFASGVDIYTTMAARIYMRPAERIGKKSMERQVGKSAVLGCGYGMGDKRFLAYGQSQGAALDAMTAATAVMMYRKQYPAIPAWWRELEQKFKAAVLQGGSYSVTGGVVIARKNGGVVVTLPSRRSLYYHYAEVGGDGQITFLDLREDARRNLWGGILAENIVQAVARDVLADRMLALDREGLNPLMSVHDEIICQVPFDGLEENFTAFEKIMNTAPAWLSGLPLKTESEICTRYHK